MITSMKDIMIYTGKIIPFLVYHIHRAAWEHPFVLGLVFFFLLLYNCLPFLFGLLISSSPILVCTAILLGLLLSFGQPNIPVIEEEEKTQDSSPLRVHSVADEKEDNDEKISPIVRDIQNREIAEYVATMEDNSADVMCSVVKSQSGVPPSASSEEEGREREAFSDAIMPPEVDIKQVHVEEMTNKDGALKDRVHFEMAGIHELASLQTELSKNAHVTTSVHNQVEVLKVGAQEPAVEGELDPYILPSLKLVGNHDESESDSDHAESSSPDASMTDIIPMLYELHPLLDSEDPQPVNASIDDLHSISSNSEDGETDDGSGAEETGNQGEEEEETKEDKEDGAVLAVKWTEDDAKNLLVLGTSELERNQRLENLIAKRKARKSFSMIAEKDLIDLGGNEMDEHSLIQLQISHISTSRRNPFDLPYDSEVNITLPPIPGSAPSVLLPRRNPFDLPIDQTEEGGGFTGAGQQNFVAAPQRDMVFRRHESFALGASSTGELNPEKHDVKLGPYFIPERTHLDAAGFSHFQRQLSDKSDSKTSSIPESETASSIADQDNDEELPEQNSHKGSEYEFLSPTDHAKHVERETSSSNEVNLVDTLCRNDEISVYSSQETDSSTTEAFDASVNDISNDFRKLDGQGLDDLDLYLPTSNASKSNVAEESTRSGSSSSSELSSKDHCTNKKGSSEVQLLSGGSSNNSSCSMHSTTETVEVVNDCHYVEPVYDSSPSTIEKSLFNTPSHKGSFDFNSPVETSGIGSQGIADRNISSVIATSVSNMGSVGEVCASHNGEPWLPPSSLSCVEENESRSREVGEIREQDIIQVEFTEDIDEYDHCVASEPPEFAIERSLSYSSESDSNSKSSEDSVINLVDREEIAGDAPHLDALGTSDSFMDGVESVPLLESSATQASIDTPIRNQLIEMPHGSAEGVSECFVHENEYKNTSALFTNNELIASLEEVSSSNISHLGEEPYFHNNSTEKMIDNDNMNKKVLVPENGDAVALLPGVHIPISTSNSVEFQRMELHAKSKEADLSISKQDKSSVEVKTLKGIDDEALLMELDAIGDFGVEEFRSSDSRRESSPEYTVNEEVLSEKTSYIISETECKISLVETPLDMVEESRDLEEIEARSLDDIHAILKHISGATEPIEIEFISSSQESDARLFEGSCMQVPSHPLDEDTYVGSNHFSKCNDDFSLKLKFDASTSDAKKIRLDDSSDTMGTQDALDMGDVEARSVAA